MQAVEKKESPIYIGQEHTITAPSGREITFRETNGEDDAILSRMGNMKDASSEFNFLANIVTNDSIKKGKPLVEDILNWLSNDRYYTLFKQRLINHGAKLEFKHICVNPSCKNSQKDIEVDIHEDLTKFDADLSKDDYVPTNKFQIRKYPYGKDEVIEFVTSSKKTFKYKLLTGAAEKRQLDMSSDELTKNTRITMRELQVKTSLGTWEMVTNFHSYSSREMSEIRKNILDNDPMFNPIITFSCPVCLTPYPSNIFAIPDFYFPEEVI